LRKLTKIEDFSTQFRPLYLPMKYLTIISRHPVYRYNIIEYNCLLMGHKVIIPNSLRKEILNLFLWITFENHTYKNVNEKLLVAQYVRGPRKFIGSCELWQYSPNFFNNNILHVLHGLKSLGIFQYVEYH